jgi:hypothetical protein
LAVSTSTTLPADMLFILATMALTSLQYHKYSISWSTDTSDINATSSI